MFLGGVYLPRVYPARGPDPDRRLHAARRPGPAGRLARDARRSWRRCSAWRCHGRRRGRSRSGCSGGSERAVARRRSRAGRRWSSVRHERRDEADLGAVRRRDARLVRVRPARVRDVPGAQRRRPGDRLAADDPRDRARSPRRGSTSCYTRPPQPTAGHRLAASTCSSSGCWSSPRSLMLRAAALLHLHDRRASSTPRSCGRCRSPSSASPPRSILVNTLIGGFPQNPEGWTFYLAIIVVQTLAIGAGVGHRREDHRAERGAARRRSPGSRRRSRRTPGSTPSC